MGGFNGEKKTLSSVPLKGQSLGINVYIVTTTHLSRILMNHYMRYCKKCVMPDTRPGIKFGADGVCIPCRHHENRAHIDWDGRWREWEALADRYRGSNGDSYDCINTVSAGKDSLFQTYVLKEKLGLNPLLVMVNNSSWTETGRHNWNNLLTTCWCRCNSAFFESESM